MKPARILLASLILLDIFVWRQMAGGERGAAYFLDVGQGDSELLAFDNGARLLVDAGPGSEAGVALAKVLPDSERYIDVGLITHAQLDHYGGFLPLLDRYSFGVILWNGRDPDEPSEHWERLKSEIIRRKIPFVEVEAGDRLLFGEEIADILSPTPDLWASTELNDGCVVARITQSALTTLLTCDAGSLVERRLLEASVDLTADVLKVGHHGSRYSSNELFLRRVAPAVAAIEVGARNSYGHPGAETLARIASSTGARIFRTDRNGTFTVRSAAGILRVSAERSGDK